MRTLAKTIPRRGGREPPSSPAAFVTATGHFNTLASPARKVQSEKN